ncbi:MAG TPA: penicillin-binding protein 2 [Solirubrobacteraceae bacterium]|nr:penicillin-binding protein 2 [Solirubrobacteraceae bacterium]
MNRLPDDKRLQFVPQEERPPMSPQLALRVAILGCFALALFAIIFFRLWFLQVLSGDQYLAQASSNQVRQIAIPAPRGQMFDRSGTLLVDSTSVPAVLVSPPDLPVPLTPATITAMPAADLRMLDRLAKVLGTSRRPGDCPIGSPYGTVQLPPIPCLVDQSYAKLPYATVTVKKDVAQDVQYYLQERQDQFPGVSVQLVWLRKYPLNTLAAQLFGTIGPITPAETKDPRYAGVSQSDIVGQSGLEWYYDQFLRGRDGAEKVQVDALGRFQGDLGVNAPTPGHSLKLSLDVKLQQVGQNSLAQSIATNYPANGGAFVAMNPTDGEIYAMGSLPSFDPNVFTHPLTTAAYKALNNSANGYPLINRAIQSAGPTGSTFKPITSTAALASGAWSPGEVYDDTGQFCEAGGLCRHNAGNAAYGVLDIVNALRVSSDDFFYHLGALLNVDVPQGGQLQRWARLYGIGQTTGVDLGGEVSGNLPTPLWRQRIDDVELRCEKRHHPHLQPSQYFTLAVSCGIADGRPWSEGDNVNLAVGQGDVQVTPLQLAVAYSAIANGGTIVRPHVGLEIDNSDGTLDQRINPPPVRHIPVDPTTLSTIRAGLHAAAQSPGGTSFDVMGNFPMPVYGKTGTAQYSGQQDYSWYVCFVKDTSTPIVVVVWVEQGGFGAVAAAPVARQILSQWFFRNPGKFIAGSSKTL